MKLFINTTNLKQGGSLQVSASVLNEFIAFPENEYHVFLSPQFAAVINRSSFPANFHFYEAGYNPISSFSNLIKFRKMMHAHERKLRPDFVLTIFGPGLWKPKAPHLVGFANGLYLYDKSRFIQEIWLNTPLKRLYFYLRRAILLRQLKKEATLVWTETEYARGELSKALKISREKISVISNTYGPAYESAPKSAVEYIQERPFNFLYLTADYPHKNLELFNALIPELKQRGINCRFTLTLPQEIFEKRFAGYLHEPMLRNIGPLVPAEGPAAYSAADALFFPSLIETFSANYPEAMVMQRPILTSDLPFAHDICMDAAVYFDPFDVRSAADAIEQIINEPELRRELVDRGLKCLQGFSTARQRAEKLLNIVKHYVLSSR